MELYTERLVLRTVTEGDLDEVARMWDNHGRISPEHALKAIESMRSNHEKNKNGAIYHLCFAVFQKGDGKIIGWCGLDGICAPGKTVIFYSIAEAHRNRGYATQCARKLLDYAFQTAGLRCVHGGCDKDNIASYKVMAKAGMLPYELSEDGDPQFYMDQDGYAAMR